MKGPKAEISPKAKIGQNCKIFPFVYIEDDVEIGFYIRNKRGRVSFGAPSFLLREVCIYKNKCLKIWQFEIKALPLQKIRSEEAMAAKNKMTKEECYAKLAEQYDGYHFGIDTKGVYNPYSLLRAFFSQNFGDYWFDTGTPTFLINVLRLYWQEIPDMEKVESTISSLGKVESYKNDIVPLLYQSGYLTIKASGQFGLVELGYPNKEVARCVNFSPKTRSISEWKIEER